MIDYAKLKNKWLKVNYRMVSDLRRQLVEHDMAGSYGGKISLKALVKIIDILIVEIEKLEEEKRNLINEISSLKGNS
jgi:hypothetical protein